MSWVKVDDNAPDDPRVLKLPRGVRLLHFEALAWCSRHATGGAIPAGSLLRLTDEPDPQAAVAALVEASLWIMTADGWQLIWLQDDQPSPELVAKWRERNRTKQDRHRRHVSGDHSTCLPKYCKAASNPVSHGVSNPTPSRPVPSHTGKGTDMDGNAAGLVEPAAAVMEEVPHPQVEAPTRRELGRMVREAPNQSLHGAYLSVFRKTYGHLYEGGAAA